MAKKQQDKFKATKEKFIKTDYADIEKHERQAELIAELESQKDEVDAFMRGEFFKESDIVKKG
jgi:hypothetical protein